MRTVENRVIAKLNAKIDLLIQEQRQLRTRFDELLAIVKGGSHVIDKQDDVVTASSPRQEYARPIDEPIAVFEEIFRAALLESEEEGFKRFLSFMHSDTMSGYKSVEHLRGFTWRHLRKNINLYVKENDPKSFSFVRTIPTEPSQEDSQIKFFVCSDNRNPVPVTLKRDKNAGDSWRITFCSL